MQIRLGAFSKLFAIGVASAIAFSGCSAVKNGFHSGFREGFQKSYMQACESRPGMNDYCGCTFDYLTKKYSDEELMKMTTTDSDMMKTAVNDAAHACVAKLPKGMTIN